MNLLNDISINQLAEHVNTTIENFLSLANNRTVVFDCDGTLTAIQHTQTSILPCKNDDLDEYAKDNNIYTNIRPLATIQFIVQQLPNEAKYVLSVSKPNIKEQKEMFVLDNFDFDTNHVLQVNSVEQKILILSQLYEKHRKEILFVEDDLQILLKAEETLPYVHGFHISHFIY